MSAYIKDLTIVLKDLKLCSAWNRSQKTFLVSIVSK